MSQWTHVSGCLRIDGLPQMGMTPDIKRIIGTPSTRFFQDRVDEPYAESKNIPSGSEGSIQYDISDAGDGMVWKTVAVWGDLRDFGADDVHEIDEWFTRIVEASKSDNIMASKLILRAAHVVVEVEYGMRYMLVAKDGEVERVELAAVAT